MVSERFENALRSSVVDAMKPNRRPQKGDPILKRLKSETVTIKEMSAPRVKFPLKAILKLPLRTFKSAKPTRVAMKAFGVPRIRVVNNGDNSPNVITPMHAMIAAVY